MRSFVKIKSSRFHPITLLFTDIDKSCPSSDFLIFANMSYKTIRENKILIGNFLFYSIHLNLFHSFLARRDFCRLLITYANSLDSDQDQHFVGPVLDPNCLTN